MIIATDIDGVILDFEPHWLAFAKKLTGYNLAVINNDAFNLAVRYGLSTDEVDLIWSEFASQEGWKGIPTHDCALGLSARLSAAGATMVVSVSSASKALHDQRLASLIPSGLHLKPLYLVGHGGEKLTTLKAINPDMFIDDQLAHLLSAKQAGVENLVWLDRGIPQMRPDLIDDWEAIATHRLGNMHEVVDLVSELTSHDKFRVKPS